MTKVRSSVVRSAQIARSVRRSPFRKGSAREKAWKFLSIFRTLAQFSNWAKRLGVNGPNLLRVLKKSPLFYEAVDGTIRMRRSE